MYCRELTNGAKREFIKSIMDNEERDYMAVAMIKNFLNNEWSTEEIEEEMYK